MIITQHIWTKHPKVVFKIKKKAISYFQYRDYKKRIYFLKIAQEQYPNYFLLNFFVAFKCAKKNNIKKVYEAFRISDTTQKITSVKGVLFEVKEMTKTAYLKIAFITNYIKIKK